MSMSIFSSSTKDDCTISSNTVSYGIWCSRINSMCCWRQCADCQNDIVTFTINNPYGWIWQPIWPEQRCSAGKTMKGDKCATCKHNPENCPDYEKIPPT